MYVLYDIAKEKFLIDQSGSVRYFLTKADVSRWIKDFGGDVAYKRVRVSYLD